jgi:hypothetical protein
MQNWQVFIPDELVTHESRPDIIPVISGLVYLGVK